MNEFTRSLLYIALLICIPIVTACIKKGIAVAVDAINAQTQNIKVQRLVREIGDAVANAVAAMNQTYVNDLKAAGTFNEAEQKEALMRAVSAALKSMSSDAQDYIKSNFGDTTQYLENRIEAQIDANHVAAKQGIFCLHGNTDGTTSPEKSILKIAKFCYALLTKSFPEGSRRFPIHFYP